jgi:hypothetical protein
VSHLRVNNFQSPLGKFNHSQKIHRYTSYAGFEQDQSALIVKKFPSPPKKSFQGFINDWLKILFPKFIKMQGNSKIPKRIGSIFTTEDLCKVASFRRIYINCHKVKLMIINFHA